MALGCIGTAEDQGRRLIPTVSTLLLEGRLSLTFDTRIFCQVVDDEFTRVNVLVYEWDALLGTTATKHRDSSQAGARRTNDLFRSVRTKLRLFLFES